MYKVIKEISTKSQLKNVRFRGVSVPDWLQQIHEQENIRNQYPRYVSKLDDLERIDVSGSANSETKDNASDKIC